ncbi:hypothetical protein I4U23_027633 [Adineta vaga]|nr:hypothetical protein I4U23_027633 [Adineta vaga]
MSLTNHINDIGTSPLYVFDTIFSNKKEKLSNEQQCIGAVSDGALTPAVVPITVLVIFSLFFCQQWGTSKIRGVFLSVTGSEALFAGLVVFPPVVVNYLGQGVLLIHHLESILSFITRMIYWPMVILATIATNLFYFVFELK